MIIKIMVFTGMLCRKGRLKKMYSPPVNKTVEMVTTDMEKAEVLNNFFLPQFLMIIYFPITVKPLKLKTATGGRKPLP